jgi:hypothetical protein
MTMNNQDAATICRAMKGMLLDRDRAVSAEMTEEKLIVIARDITNPGALASLSKDLLDNVVMLLWSINPTTKRPDIDQIAHDVESFEFVLPEKIE